MTEIPSRRPSALVVYESMYGNTRAVAEAIAEGLSSRYDVITTHVSEAASERLSAAQLVVAGAPIHAWGLSRASTRKAAADAAGKPGSGLSMAPHWDALPGMREWLAGLSGCTGKFVAFDTRFRAPFGLTGSAARKIARRLRASGFEECAARGAFRVTKQNRLAAGELDRARRWGQTLATAETGLPTTTTGQSK